MSPVAYADDLREISPIVIGHPVRTQARQHDAVNLHALIIAAVRSSLQSASCHWRGRTEPRRFAAGPKQHVGEIIHRLRLARRTDDREAAAVLVAALPTAEPTLFIATATKKVRTTPIAHTIHPLAPSRNFTSSVCRSGPRPIQSAPDRCRSRFDRHCRHRFCSEKYRTKVALYEWPFPNLAFRSPWFASERASKITVPH